MINAALARTQAAGGPGPDVGETVAVRIRRNGEVVGPEFEWTHVGAHHLGRCAGRAGYRVEEAWTPGGRTFVALRPTDASPVVTTS